MIFGIFLSASPSSLPLQRSYSKEVFDACISLMTKNQIKPLNLIGQFQEFSCRVEREVAAALQQDIEYGVIPDEFKGRRYSNLTKLSIASFLSLSVFRSNYEHGNGGASLSAEWYGGRSSGDRQTPAELQHRPIQQTATHSGHAGSSA